MAHARFVFISDGVDGLRGVDGLGQEADDRIWWRLVAANNRVLGRSVGTDRGEDACRHRAAELRDRVDDAVSLLAMDGLGHWTWSVALDSVERARCAHPFARRVDCRRTLALFLQGARTADPQAGCVRYFAARSPSAVTR